MERVGSAHVSCKVLQCAKVAAEDVEPVGAIERNFLLESDIGVRGGSRSRAREYAAYVVK